MKFGLINQLLRESLTNSTKEVEEMKLGIFEMKDYTKIMNTERKCIFSTKMICRWRRRVKSRINISVLEKQHSVISQNESHFPLQFEKQFQVRNRSQRHNSAMTKCQKRKHLLQIIK